MSASTVTYGDEEAERLSVAVSAPLGTPGGQVSIEAGTATLCTITLSAGEGSCTLPATKFGAGTVSVTASYGGAAGFAASTSTPEPFTVTKATPKSTNLTLSAAKVTYGHEQSERFTVTVAAPHAGTPTGKVHMKAGSIALCSFNLSGGKGSCTLAAKGLPAGGYHVTASYGGDGNFNGSTSASKALTIAK